MLNALSQGSVVPQKTDLPSYEEKLNSLIQRTPCLERKMPNGKIITAFFIEKIAEGNVPTKNGEKTKIKATAYMSLNSTSLKNIDLVKAVQLGQIVAMEEVNGIIQKMYIHPWWIQYMKEENALEVVVREAESEKYIWPEKNDNVFICSLTKDAYIRTVQGLGLGEFILGRGELIL